MSEVLVVYSSPTLTVSKISSPEKGSYCVITRCFSSAKAASEAYGRLEVQRTVKHPSICEVYTVSKDDAVVRSEVEWCGEAASTGKWTWTQDECWYLLYAVTTALAYAQKQGVTHGNLQPGAIYRSEDGYYKVGEFVCPALPIPTSYFYEVKLPFFLSPEAKQVYSQLLLGRSVEAIYNCYKADVYSLGLLVGFLLQPESFSQLIQPVSTAEVVASLPLNPSLQSVIQRMLTWEENQRPDWAELEETLQSFLNPQSLEEVKQIEAREETGKKRRFKIKSRQAPAEASAQEIVPQHNEKPCSKCGKAFILSFSEPWRLDLIGSTRCAQAANYCSLRCFQQSAGPEPSPQEEYPEESEEEEGELVEEMLIDIISGSAEMFRPFAQFYHCFTHSVRCRQLLGGKAPTVLTRCPECPTGDLTVEVMPKLDVEIVKNSSYPALVFVKETVGVGSRSRNLYVAISVELRESFYRAECHICSQALQQGNWMYLFHGPRLDLCCFPCYVTLLGMEFCPVCSNPFDKFIAKTPNQRVYIKQLGKFKGRLLVRDEDWCYICHNRPSDYTLPCGHAFCLSCIAIQPDQPGCISCLKCGRKLDKADLPDLVQQLGWSS